MPFEKKIDHIAKGRSLYITNQDWAALSKWNILEKGDQVVEEVLFNEAKELF
jgi:hypothetical protein